MLVFDDPRDQGPHLEPRQAAPRASTFFAIRFDLRLVQTKCDIFSDPDVLSAEMPHRDSPAIM